MYHLAKSQMRTLIPLSWEITSLTSEYKWSVPLLFNPCDGRQMELSGYDAAFLSVSHCAVLPVALQALRKKKRYEKNVKHIDCAVKAMRSAHEYM